LTRAIPAVEPEIREWNHDRWAGVSAERIPSLSKIAAAWSFLYPRSIPGNGLESVAGICGATREGASGAIRPTGIIDGGKEVAHDPSLTSVSYAALEPARNLLLAKVQKQSDSRNGPENLRTAMAALRPSDLQLDQMADPVLSRFDLKVLTEGSGTQIFSTTFAQWAARERCGGRNC